jgi:hypothetical protein
MRHIMLYEKFRDYDEIPKQFRQGEDPYDFSSRFKLAAPKAKSEEWPEFEDEEDYDEELQKNQKLKKFMSKHRQDPHSEPASSHPAEDNYLYKAAIRGSL